MLIQNYMKKEILKSKEVVNILKKQKQVHAEITKIHQELVRADKKHKALQFKMQRLKDKGVKALDTAIKENGVLDELDYTGALEIIDDKSFSVEIHNLFDDNFGDIGVIKQRLLDDKKNKQGMWSDPLMFTGHRTEE